MPVTGLIAGGANLIGGAIKGIVGIGQKRKGNKLLNSLEYPTEEIPQEVVNAASTGLPSEQYNQAMQNIQRQQSTAMSRSQDRRGGLGLIGGIQAGTNNATLGLDVANAKTRQANQFRLASWKDKVWQNNIKDKYNRDYNYGMGLVGMGNQNLVGGIDQGLAGVGKGLLSGIGGGGGGNSTTPQPVYGAGDGFNRKSGYATGISNDYI